MMRGSVRALTTRRSHQLARGQLLKCVKERTLHLVKDVEVHDAQVASPNDCFVPEVQHHHGSQLLAAVMAHWLSSSHFGSSQPPWNHPHVAVPALILRITYMRPSGLLEFLEEGSSPIACATSQAGIRDGSVLTDQSAFRWVNKLLHPLECGDIVEQNWS